MGPWVQRASRMTLALCLLQSPVLGGEPETNTRLRAWACGLTSSDSPELWHLLSWDPFKHTHTSFLCGVYFLPSWALVFNILLYRACSGREMGRGAREGRGGVGRGGVGKCGEQTGGERRGEEGRGGRRREGRGESILAAKAVPGAMMVMVVAVGG